VITLMVVLGYAVLLGDVLEQEISKLYTGGDIIVVLN
jgi:hypothetical protein